MMAHARSLLTKRSPLMSGTKKMQSKKRLSQASRELWRSNNHNSIFKDQITKINSISILILKIISLQPPKNPICPKNLKNMSPGWTPPKKAWFLLKINQLLSLKKITIKKWQEPWTRRATSTLWPTNHPDAINSKISNVLRLKIIRRLPGGKRCLMIITKIRCNDLMIFPNNGRGFSNFSRRLSPTLSALFVVKRHTSNVSMSSVIITIVSVINTRSFVEKTKPRPNFWNVSQSLMILCGRRS